MAQGQRPKTEEQADGTDSLFSMESSGSFSGKFAASADNDDERSSGDHSRVPDWRRNSISDDLSGEIKRTGSVALITSAYKSVIGHNSS